MADVQVIIVDDQRLVREGIASLLNIQEGITVIGTAENGRDGVMLATELHPDIILMDIRMPVMDGIQAVENLNRKGYKGKVIMLTTFDDEEYILKSLQAGAVGYLMKDIPSEDLARAVKQAYNGVFQMTRRVMDSLVQTINRTHEEEEELSEIPGHQMKMINELSVREKEVFTAIGKGLTNNEIAESLYLSEGTIKNYVSSIFTSLGLRDRVQAALVAARYMKNADSPD